MHRPVSIFSLTPAGHSLGERLQRLLSATQEKPVANYQNSKPFAVNVQTSFTRGDGLILICATGIAVRTLAPVLVDKKTDPPVLVLDEQGQFVIPLLSGHEGGANHWAQQVAKKINAQLVMTTARTYLSPIYTVGMGCERGCPAAHLSDFFQQTIADVGLTVADIASINSIDIKADEVGLIALAKQFNVPFQTFSKTELSTVEHLLSTRSDYVYNTVGVYGVAESAALYALSTVENSTQTEPELVQKKVKTNKATCAIARKYRDAPVENKEPKE